MSSDDCDRFSTDNDATKGGKKRRRTSSLSLETRERDNDDDDDDTTMIVGSNKRRRVGNEKNDNIIIDKDVTLLLEETLGARLSARDNDSDSDSDKEEEEKDDDESRMIRAFFSVSKEDVFVMERKKIESHIDAQIKELRRVKADLIRNIKHVVSNAHTKIEKNLGIVEKRKKEQQQEEEEEAKKGARDNDNDGDLFFGLGDILPNIVEQGFRVIPNRLSETREYAYFCTTRDDGDDEKPLTADIFNVTREMRMQKKWLYERKSHATSYWKYKASKHRNVANPDSARSLFENEISDDNVSDVNLFRIFASSQKRFVHLGEGFSSIIGSHISENAEDVFFYKKIACISEIETRIVSCLSDDDDVIAWKRHHNDLSHIVKLYSFRNRFTISDLVHLGSTNKANYELIVRKGWLEKIKNAILKDKHKRNSDLVLAENKSAAIRRAETIVRRECGEETPSSSNIILFSAFKNAKTSTSKRPLSFKRTWVEQWRGYCTACLCISDHCKHPKSHFGTKYPPNGYSFPKKLNAFLERAYETLLAYDQKNHYFCTPTLTKEFETIFKRNTIPSTFSGHVDHVLRDKRALLCRLMGPNYALIKQLAPRVRKDRERRSREERIVSNRWPPEIYIDWSNTIEKVAKEEEDGSADAENRVIITRPSKIICNNAETNIVYRHHK